MNWFWSIFRNLPLLFAVIGAWAHISVNCSIAFLFWRYRLCSMFSLRGFLVCFWKVQVLFCCSVFFYRLMSFINARPLYFHCFSGPPAFFCKYQKKTLVTSEDQSVHFFFFLCFNCFLVLYSVYSNTLVLKTFDWSFLLHSCKTSPVGGESVFLVGGNRKTTQTFWDAFKSCIWCSKFVQLWRKEKVGNFSLTSLFWQIMLPCSMKRVF